MNPFRALHRCSVAVDVSLLRKSQSWNLYLYLYKYKTIISLKNRVFLTATLQRCNGVKKSISFA